VHEHVETEWQFESAVPPQRWLRGTELPDGFGLRPPVAQDIADTYYDTEDWRVYRAGYALRVRQTGHTREATLKELGAAHEGRHDRRELSAALTVATSRSVDDGAPPRNILERLDGVLADRLSAVVGTHPVRPIVELQTRRRCFPIERDGRTVGELALDVTTVPTKDTPASVRFHRVEIEVAPGVDAAELEPFVETCRHSVMLAATDESKFAAALHVRGIVPALLFDAQACVIDAATTTGAVALASLRRYFGDMLDAEPGTRLGDEPERLHDMRVAIRRLRAMLALFEDVLPRRFVAATATLEWIANALGAVRDLDVQLAHLDDWGAEIERADAEGLTVVSDVLRRRRLAARRRMMRVLDCPRYDAFVRRFATMVRGPLPRRGHARLPIVDAAPALIRKRMRKVRKLGDHVTATSAAPTYHQLRIRCKRLRYALEAHADVYGKPARRLAAVVTDLQDLLGRHQDAEVAIVDLRALCERRRPRLSARAIFVIGKIAARYEREATRLRRRFQKRYRAVVGRRWKGMRRALQKHRSQTIAAALGRQAVEVVRVVSEVTEPRSLMDVTNLSPTLGDVAHDASAAASDAAPGAGEPGVGTAVRRRHGPRGATTSPARPPTRAVR
jgi:triphosphatase